MSYFGSTEWLVEVAKGNVPGHSLLHKFGRNPDIDTGGFEDIWGGGASYTGFDAVAAETVEVFSSDANDTSAGTGARTVEVYGLDVSYVEQDEIVTLTGVTAVDTVNTYLRLDRMIIRSAGSGGKNAGTITARQKVTTANIYAALPIGYNQTMIAASTIPAAKTGYPLSWFMSLSGKTSANHAVQLLYRPLGEVFQVKEEVALMGSGTSYVHRIFRATNEPIVEKTDIVIRADSDTNNTAISAGFDILLVEDGF